MDLMKDGVTQSSYAALTQTLMSINSSSSDLMYREHSSIHKEGNNNIDFFFSIFLKLLEEKKTKSTFLRIEVLMLGGMSFLKNRF